MHLLNIRSKVRNRLGGSFNPLGDNVSDQRTPPLHPLARLPGSILCLEILHNRGVA